MDSSHGEGNSLESHSLVKLSGFCSTAQDSEPLGSVTHSQEIDGTSTSLQIRSSARVSKKMRLDSTAAPVVTAVADKVDKKVPDHSKEEDKHEKADKNDKHEKADKHSKGDQHDKADGKPNEVKGKPKRCDLWPQEDKNTFFEALNECGKDFDKIQAHFVAKGKKRGLAEHLIKTRDQIRLFYYRTWHKVSKHLKLKEVGGEDDIKSATKELYGLINYGEIRKRVGFCTEKILCTKLSELVYNGTVQIRIRGKTLRIKTPLCKALRKVNRITECQQEILKLPARVTIELRPRTNSAWTHVQAAFMNPRIRIVLPLQRRLSSLLTYLSRRWRPPQLKHRESLLNTLKHNSETKLKKLEAENRKKVKEPLLHVAPYPGTQICLPTVNLTEYLTSTNICLISYLDRVQIWKAEGSIRFGPKGNKGSTSRKGGKRQRVDSASEKKEQHPIAEVVNVRPKKESACLETEFVNCGVTINNPCDNKRERTGDHLESGVKSGVNNMAVNNVLPLQPHSDVGLETVPPPEADTKEEVDNKTEILAQSSMVQPTKPELSSKQEEAEEIINKIRAGWTLEEANSITIGELYLMFGSQTKLKMEYWFENVPSESASESSPSTSTADSTPVPTPGQAEKEIQSEVPPNNVAQTLQKLISIAKLNYRKAKVICPCGHICGIKRPPINNVRRQPPVRNLMDNGIGVQPLRPAVSVSVTSMQDGVFRRPLLAPSQFKLPPKPGTAEAFKAQLEKFKPRYCNRRGRTVRPKNVVVQRMLPLLPKAPNGHAMVTLKVIPQSSQLSGEFLPIGATTVSASPQPSQSHPAPLLPRPSKTPHILPAASSMSATHVSLLVPSTSASGLPSLEQDTTPVTIQQTVSDAGNRGVTLLQDRSSAATLEAVASNLHSSLSVNSSPVGLQQVTLTQSCSSMSLNHSTLASGCLPSTVSTCSSTHASLPLRASSPLLNTPVASPPSISNLLELSLPSNVEEELGIATGTGSGLLGVPMQENPAADQPNFVGLLSTDGSLQTSETPPTSPSRILKEADKEWLNSEVADFSLSSFLGQLESPAKSVVSNATNEDTRLCSDVEAQLQCLMSENSVDYMAKFADLAAQIASSDASSKK